MSQAKDPSTDCPECVIRGTVIEESQHLVCTECGLVVAPNILEYDTTYTGEDAELCSKADVHPCSVATQSHVRSLVNKAALADDPEVISRTKQLQAGMRWAQRFLDRDQGHTMPSFEHFLSMYSSNLRAYQKRFLVKARQFEHYAFAACLLATYYRCEQMRMEVSVRDLAREILNQNKLKAATVHRIKKYHLDEEQAVSLIGRSIAKERLVVSYVLKLPPVSRQQSILKHLHAFVFRMEQIQPLDESERARLCRQANHVFRQMNYETNQGKAVDAIPTHVKAITNMFEPVDEEEGEEEEEEEEEEDLSRKEVRQAASKYESGDRGGYVAESNEFSESKMLISSMDKTIAATVLLMAFSNMVRKLTTKDSRENPLVSVAQVQQLTGVAHNSLQTCQKKVVHDLSRKNGSKSS
jgi:hypothetical protein